jgi:hypothetical protein
MPSVSSAPSAALEELAAAQKELTELDFNEGLSLLL